MTLAIRNARVLGTNGSAEPREVAADILIAEGRILEIGSGSGWTSDETLDARGCLVLPGLVDAHIHPDKAFLGEKRPNQSGTVQEGFEILTEFKRAYVSTEVCERALRLMHEAVRHGTTAMRAFCDVGTIGGLVPLEGLLMARESMSGLLDVQIVAFPEEGLLRDQGAAQLVEEALKMGADVVGGLPGWEHTDAQAQEHIDICFGMADRYSRPLHMVVDPLGDTRSRALEYLAVETLRRGGSERSVAVSWDSLSFYNDAYASKIITLLAEAGITIVSAPSVALTFHGRSFSQPVPRGITRVRELMDAGVNVASAQDDVNDPFYPFGKPDLLEVAFFLSHQAHMTAPSELYRVIETVTVNAARALDLEDYGVGEGCRADLVVLNASNVHEALRTREERRAVIKAGRIVGSAG